MRPIFQMAYHFHILEMQMRASLLGYRARDSVQEEWDVYEQTHRQMTTIKLIESEVIWILQSAQVKECDIGYAGRAERWRKEENRSLQA